MTEPLGKRARRLLISGAIAALSAAGTASPALAGNKLAAASSPTATAALSAASTSGCTTATLVTPFAGDSNAYALVPGQAFDSFTGSGWTLSGGAAITTAALADGGAGSVLELPRGATAISPPMCVQSDYPNARAMIRSVSGSQAVELSSQYAGATSFSDNGRFTGSGAGWSASNPVRTNPGSQAGWQLVVFELQGSSKAGEEQIYNFYVDPRMKG